MKPSHRGTQDGQEQVVMWDADNRPKEVWVWHVTGRQTYSVRVSGVSGGYGFSATPVAERLGRREAARLAGLLLTSPTYNSVTLEPDPPDGEWILKEQGQ